MNLILVFGGLAFMGYAVGDSSKEKGNHLPFPYACKDLPLNIAQNIKDVNTTCIGKLGGLTGPCQATPGQKYHKNSCYSSCFWEGLGVLNKDNVVNAEALKTFVNAVYPAAAAGAIIENTKLCTVPGPAKPDQCSCSPVEKYSKCFKKNVKLACKNLEKATAAVPKTRRRRAVADPSATQPLKGNDANTDCSASSEEDGEKCTPPATTAVPKTRRRRAATTTTKVPTIKPGCSSSSEEGGKCTPE